MLGLTMSNLPSLYITLIIMEHLEHSNLTNYIIKDGDSFQGHILL